MKAMHAHKFSFLLDKERIGDAKYDGTRILVGFLLGQRPPLSGPPS